jgi:glutamyl-tRNA reductase
MTVCTSPIVVPPSGDEAPLGIVAAFVAHARRVPSAVREEFAEELAALEPSDAMIVVHTCHRVELYVALRGLGDRPLPEPPPGAQRLDDVDAARHLISVACGLDSAILGEDQILHQIREALAAHRAAQSLDPVLNRLFQVALHAGRRAHGWFSGLHRSLGDVALERIERGAGLTQGQPILVVGAGTMGRLATMSATRRGAQVIVTSRTDERAAALAREVGGRTIPFAVDGTLPPVAGAIVALSGSWQISPEGARRLVESDAIVVDLSSPPAVAAPLQAELGDRFVSVDDLAWGPDIELRGGLRARLERLVSESGSNYCHWLRTRDDALPAIQAMAKAAEERRRNELEWLHRRLPDLTKEQRSLIDQMSNRLVAGILHAPRSALNSDASGDLGRAARELFGL